jgi:hypothetical protein
MSDIVSIGDNSNLNGTTVSQTTVPPGTGSAVGGSTSNVPPRKFPWMMGILIVAVVVIALVLIFK